MKLDEIARLAGVSRTTASYVINGKAKQYRVSDKTVEKVMAVVREHNYHPNAVAAGLRAGRTRSTLAEWHVRGACLGRRVRPKPLQGEPVHGLYPQQAE